ncbi:uracil-DNA glycosylase [Sulfuritalea hydrogenivorans]|uniref:Type-4 uracil-DNA glycosylase n=1 Tax=Sulfuritalea hydrogenivorans sk43H TaxID=1223802 RepID=W0SFK4_9PROT|nr:uracil-DNA glycosylase [Sulfuritalea hydrogenivorans]BAO30044.1 phage DNA polymerase-like protein [Sulfuritalea hydrogenivorans sk43H]
MTSDREQILREMGLGPVWKLRAAAAGPVLEEAAAPAAVELLRENVPASAPETVAVAPAVPATWNELATAVAACRQCRLCEARKQAVLGVGDIHADWLFVGEGPGAEEDQRGEPFVGQAGKLLDSMLAAIGLKRGENVYIANAVKCRPPENRTPTPEETAACKPYLERQIELIKPKLIVALGRPAAQTLLQVEVKIAAARGKLHDYRGIPLIVTYHPAYLLRTLQDKARAWEDLCFMRRTMQAGKDG